jgi:hypothetical protein
MRQRDGVKGAIYGAIYGEIIHMERDGDGENLNFAGMVGRMAAGWWELCGCAGVVWVLVWCSRVARLQGCEVARLQVYRQSKRIFAPLLLWFDYGVIDYLCTFVGLYWFGDGGGRAGWWVVGGGAGGVVVPVVVRGWQAVPPSSSVWLER